MSLTLNISVNSSSNERIRGSFGICSLGGFLNCYWFWNFIRNWLRYSSLKRSLKFWKEDLCLTLNNSAKTSSNLACRGCFKILSKSKIQNCHSFLVYYCINCSSIFRKKLSTNLFQTSWGPEKNYIINFVRFVLC